MVAFSAVFFVAFVYMVARGALDWGPLQKVNTIEEVNNGPVISQPRGVRVVGTEGRAEQSEQAA
jgi:hypothetical protein